MRISSLALAFTALAVMPMAAVGENGQTAPSATTPSATTAPAPAGNSADQASDLLDTIVCKKMAPPTGTRLGGRTICDTNRHWQELQRRSQEEVTKMQTRGGFSGPGPGN